MSEYRIIGRDHPLKDLVPKITGKARYAEDFRAEGMLFAKLFLSPMPRGRVRRLDASRALALDGVVAADSLARAALTASESARRKRRSNRSVARNDRRG
jgi:CO/xanthine dehydrogenase Mo-binding subunit